MLLTSEMETSDDEIIDMYRGLWRIEESFKVTKSELEARPVYVWTKAHFLTCFVALTIARILENKLERKYSIGTILESLSKAKCSLIQQNYYLFDYYDEVLKDIERVTDIDFGKRIRTLGEIKKVLAKTQKQKKHHENLTKQKARQALYLLGLTGVLYPFSCKSQGLSQLLEYEKSMRTTAFLPFIPYEK